MLLGLVTSATAIGQDDLAMTSDTRYPMPSLDAPQPTVQEETREETATPGFRLNMLKAARKAYRDGKIDRRTFRRVRVGMLVPGVAKAAEDAAIMQLNSQNDPAVDNILPIGEDGKIDRSGINWENLLAFLERLIPIILQIITIFAGG